MESALLTQLDQSPWMQLEKAESINRQRRSAKVVQDFFKGATGFDGLVSSLDHLRYSNGTSLDGKFIPFELRTSIIDALSAAQYLESESLFSRKLAGFIDRCKRSGGQKAAPQKGLTKTEELKLAGMTADYQAWCGLPESEKELRHNTAEGTLLKFMILSSHLQDDATLSRGSLGIDGYSEQGARLTVESQLQQWLTLDSHEKITEGHTKLLGTLESVISGFVSDPTSLPLDIKLSMIDLYVSMKDAQRTYETVAHPADMAKFGERMKKAEGAAAKYLLAEQAA